MIDKLKIPGSCRTPISNGAVCNKAFPCLYRGKPQLQF